MSHEISGDHKLWRKNCSNKKSGNIQKIMLTMNKYLCLLFKESSSAIYDPKQFASRLYILSVGREFPAGIFPESFQRMEKLSFPHDRSSSKLSQSITLVCHVYQFLRFLCRHLFNLHINFVSIRKTIRVMWQAQQFKAFRGRLNHQVKCFSHRVNQNDVHGVSCVSFENDS